MHTITLIRTLRGKRLVDLARAIGYDPTHASRMSRREVPMRAETLAKIAHFLRVPMDLLQADPEQMGDLIIQFLDQEYRKAQADDHESTEAVDEILSVA